MIALVTTCMTAVLLYYTPSVTPISSERTQELLRILEIPNRAVLDGLRGPPEGLPPNRRFKFHWDEMRELVSAGPAAIPPLIALYEDLNKPTQVRTQAAAALSQYLAGVFVEPDPRVIRAVVAAIKDRDPAVRAGVLGHIFLLGKHWNRGNPNLPHPFKTSLAPNTLRSIFPDVVAALADPDAEVAANAATAMRYLGQVGEGIPELLAVLKRDEPEVRAAAMWTLTVVGLDHPASLPAVMDELTRTDDLERYVTSVGTVGAFGPRAKAAVPRLIEALKDPRGRVPGSRLHYAATFSLGQIGPDAKAAAPLILEYQKTAKLTTGEHMMVINALEQIDLHACKIAYDFYYDLVIDFRKQNEDAIRGIRMAPGGTPPGTFPLAPAVPTRKPN